MVKYPSAAERSLDRTFAALADPTRRALLARLGDGGNLSVTELARPLPMSFPAVMTRLSLLSEAGLLVRRKTGRTVACALVASPMEHAVDWLNRYQRFWSERLDRLAAFVEEDSCPSPSPPSQASLSTAASPRRPPRSIRRGPTRKR